MVDEDLEEIRSQILKQLAFKMHAEISKPVKGGGNMPVDTGNLRASITAVGDEVIVPGTSGKQEDPPKGTVIIGTNVEYAPYMEAMFGYFAKAENKIPQFLRELGL